MRKLTIIAALSVTACVDYKQPQIQPTPVETKTPTLLKFEASPLTVVAGNPVTLSWKVADAEKVLVQVLGGATIVPDTALLEGSLSVPDINANTTFVLTATNKDKTATAQAMVTVTQVAVPTRGVITAFDLTPQAVAVGAATTLKWQTTNAVYGVIKADGALIYTIPTTDLANGQFMQSPGVDTTYTMEVKGTDNEIVVMTRALTVTTGAMAGLTGRELFDRNVAPILATNCASCHAGANVGDGPDFLGAAAAPSTGFYTPLTTMRTVIGSAPFVAYPPVNSPLVYKGAHTGPALSTSDSQTISAWLVKEAEERGLAMQQNPNPNPNQNYQPKNLREAILRFTGCMSRTDWDETYGENNATQAARQNTNDGPCYACHSTGTAGAFLSQNSGDTFDAHKNPNMIYVMKVVLGTVNNDGSFKDLVPAYRFRDKGQGPQGTPPHPSYQLTAERNDALNAFVDRTRLKFHDYTRACP